MIATIMRADVGVVKLTRTEVELATPGAQGLPTFSEQGSVNRH